MNFSISFQASSSQVRGRASLSWVASRNWQRATPTAAFLEGSCASLSRCIHIPQEFVHGGLHVGLPGLQGFTQVVSDNDLEPEELHHERLRKGLVDLSDKAHLLHHLEVELVYLIHDLGHSCVNFPPF